MRIFSFLCSLFFIVAAHAHPLKDGMAKWLHGMQEHLQKKIAEAEIIEDPFPHIVIENLFPQDFYNYALSQWPSNQHFVGQRIATNFGCIEGTGLNTNQKVFWRMFGETIVNRYIKPAIIERLKSYLHLKPQLANFPIEKLNPLTDFANLRQDSIVDVDENYYLGVHCDQLNIFSAVLIYFPEDANHPELGTTLYYPNPNPSLNIPYSNNFTFAKRIYFKPNTMHVMLQTPFSWHGADRSPYPGSYLRHFFFSPIFFSPEFMKRHYGSDYNRTMADDYFFDHRFLNKENWKNIWDPDKDAYR